MMTAIRAICFAIVAGAFTVRAAAEDFSDAIHAFLQQGVEVERRNVGIVVGIVDEHTSSIISFGKLDNGSDQDLNGDTLFEIGSVGKTFTVLLLQDMIEHGQMKLDDPVAKYLPESVKMPTRNGKEITLHQLATHTSGLPSIPDNLDPRRADNPYADYTVEKMYAFLSGYQLTRDPGATFEYSNLGVGLLGHVIALKAGTDYESLVVDRICRPLKMNSTRITLTPELKSRFATGHNQYGEVVANWDVPTLAGAGALRSTANDLLKYLAANLGLTQSSLTPLMEKTYAARLAWIVTTDPQGTQIIWHGGGTGGFESFIGFDKAHRRGVVVLSNSRGGIDVQSLGDFLLKIEWAAARRPTDTKVSGQIYAPYVGLYQRSPDFPVGMVAIRQFLRSAPKAAIYLPACLCTAVLVVLLRRTASFHKRWIIAGGSALVGGGLAALVVVVTRPVDRAPSEPGIGFRRDGDRLFVQTVGSISWPVDVLLPPIAGEVVPESETGVFERLSGNPMSFSRDAQGNVIGLTVYHGADAFSYEKVSDQPPKALEPFKPHVIIKLDTKLLDSYVGHYEFASNSVLPPPGMKLTIWREGDQLIAQAWAKDAVQGRFEIYPESETEFFLKIGKGGTQLIFIKNDQGEVAAVIHHDAGLPDFEGKKVK